MKLAALQPLALPLLAAVALHGLWLAGQRLPRPPASGGNTSAPLADNTPELVRLARRLTLEQSLRVATPLPPPPAAPAAPTAPALPRPQASSRPSQPPASTKPASTKADAKAAAKADAKAPTARKAPTRIQRRAAPAAVGTSTGSKGAPGQLLASLWSKAQPVEDAPGPLATLPPTLQLRQIGEEQARRQGLSEAAATPQVVGGDLMVAWPQGGEVWLLRLPLPKPGG